MSRNIIVGIRYSIVGPWGHTIAEGSRELSREDYAKVLLAPARLAWRRRLFARYTVPSLIHMAEAARRTGIGLKIIVGTSDRLPADELAHLTALLEPLGDHAQIVPIKLGGAISDVMREAVAALPDGICATARLDDDDGLAPGYVEALAAYLRPEFDGFVVSFSRGHYIYVDDEGEPQKAQIQRRPKIAIGLAHIKVLPATSNSHIYSLGVHVRIDEVTPVILDARELMYVRVAHLESDTYATTPETLKRELARATDAADVLEHYGLAPRAAAAEPEQARSGLWPFGR